MGLRYINAMRSKYDWNYKMHITPQRAIYYVVWSNSNIKVDYFYDKKEAEAFLNVGKRKSTMKIIVKYEAI